ncbi:MAG: hypothetical protein PHP89_04120 [Candidatus Omnitrophica bacterium]|nr:hypothetical protein [Candidatus Omnitrophota bacterium]
MEIIMDYLTGNVPQIITAVVGIGAVWLVLSKALNVLKEISELLNAIVVAFADKKLTKDEVDAIVKEAKDVPLAVKALIKKA